MSKRKISIGRMILLLLAVILLWESVVFGIANPSQQKEIKEVVKVVNIEVPVRVFYKGKPVDNLTKESFKLYENKKLQKINGFFIKKRSIQGIAEAEVVEKPKSRTFILVYQITDFNDHLKESVDYLFDNIFGENDRLLLFANDRSKEYRGISNKEQIKAEVKNTLQAQSVEKRKRLTVALTNLEKQLNINEFRRNLVDYQATQGEDTSTRMLHLFLQNYLILWKEYKKYYLTPNIKKFYYFSKFLENVKTEKWILNFYQFEFFPRIGLDNTIRRRIRYIVDKLTESNNALEVSMGRMIDRSLNKIDLELNVNKDFPTEEVSKLFYKVNATFHSFFIRSNRETLLEDFNFSKVSNSIEDSLKSITRITGGTLIASNNLKKSLETVQAKEDIYYVLTYAPENPDLKTRKINVKVTKSKCRVFFDDNVRAIFMENFVDRMKQKTNTPDVKLENFAYKEDKLHFSIKDFLRQSVSNKNIGRLQVRVKILNNRGTPLTDSTNSVEAIKEEMDFSIPFKLTEGEYTIFINVTDLLTNKNAHILKTIEL
jgi:hypothetical protein